MAEATDYFSNHRLKLRFPWSMYHQPIVAALQDFVRRSPGPAILNIGAGPFFELERLDSDGRQFTVCDIDPRAVELARTLHGSKLAGADVIIAEQPLPYPDGSFDSVVAMDVIEHVPTAGPLPDDALRVLRPGGRLFLTTPNYASVSLRLIESTALEAVAQVQGFSRRHIHPSKMTPALLTHLLVAARTASPEVETIAFGWVIVARVGKPRTPPQA